MEVKKRQTVGDIPDIRHAYSPRKEYPKAASPLYALDQTMGLCGRSPQFFAKRSIECTIRLQPPGLTDKESP
jgi:hypothetical protein